MQNQQAQAHPVINYFNIFTKLKYLVIIGVITIMTALASGVFERINVPQYTATATPINTTNSRSMLPALLQEEYMATQIGIISSQFMAEKVLNHLDFSNDPLLKPVRDSFLNQGFTEDNINSRLSRWMLGNLRVYVHNRSTRLIKIAFQSVNAQRSVMLADAFSDNYLETVLELNQAPIKSSARWIEESAAPIRVALSEAETKLSARPSSTEINEVYSLLDTAQNSLNILTSMINENRVEGVSQRDNQYLQTLNSEILENEVLLIDRSREYGTQHPEYLSVRQKLQLLQGRLGEAVSQQINSMKTTLASLNQSMALRSSVRLTNVSLLNYSAVDVLSDETGEKRAVLYGAILGLMLGIILAFLLLQHQARKPL